MFDPPPEKPSAFAYHWLVIIGGVGGGLGIAAAGLLFGEVVIDSEAVMIGTFLVGATIGVLAGSKLVMPRGGPRS